jgi:hypothetical protein
MKVTIMYRNSFVGGDGWSYCPATIEIDDDCPVCGSKRGTPHGYNFCEDGEWFNVDKWDNPCGHIDLYKDCYFESLRIQENKHGH